MSSMEALAASLSDAPSEPAQQSEPQASPAPESAPAPAEAPPQPELPSAALAGLRALADKENALRQRAQQFQEKEKYIQEYQELKELAKSDRVEALQRLGASLEGLEALKSEQSDPTAEVRKEMQQLREMVEMQQRREEELARENVYREVRDSVATYIDSSQEKHPYVTAAGNEAKDLIFQKILHTYQETGQAVSEAEAAREVEAHISKLAEKLVPVYLASQGKQAPPKPSGLTNNLASQAGTEKTFQELGSDEAFQLLLSRAKQMDL